MSYQVLARKYRPQRFEDVIGQLGITQTLSNAITSEHLAQAFVFAGPRGVGKTTTARILARALNCGKGPTPDPCGTCDPCVEIAQGRDIDVLEIDAATHTQVEHIREVIIAGLAMAPVRDRYKIFIIDEFHQLSSHSFNALLKSIEEPPPHVAFMMATTELRKIPETILSRSQVFEFRMISTKTINEQLRMIAKAEEIDADDSALGLIARSAEGSMRDAQSALDQVIAFAGARITVEAVSTVLGLIGRELVLDVVEVVANEDPPAVFDLAGRFVEAGHDLRLVCRELTRAVRDLLVIAIDPKRVQDPEIAAEAERDRVMSLAQRFSREDLLRAFDVLARAEIEIRGAAQPRYHFEMALLKWIHLRQLTPLARLIEGKTPTPKRKPDTDSPTAGTASRSGAARPAAKNLGADPPPPPVPGEGEEKPAILAEIKRAKKFFHGTVIAQAQRIELSGNHLTFTFSPAQRTLASQLNQSRDWLETIASNVTGRKIIVTTTSNEEQAAPTEPTQLGSPPAPPEKLVDEELQEKALNDTVVQAMLEVFPAEIKDVQKIE